MEGGVNFHVCLTTVAAVIPTAEMMAIGLKERWLPMNERTFRMQGTAE